MIPCRTENGFIFEARYLFVFLYVRGYLGLEGSAFPGEKYQLEHVEKLRVHVYLSITA